MSVWPPTPTPRPPLSSVCVCVPLACVGARACAPFCVRCVLVRGFRIVRLRLLRSPVRRSSLRPFLRPWRCVRSCAGRWAFDRPKSVTQISREVSRVESRREEGGGSGGGGEGVISSRGGDRVVWSPVLRLEADISRVTSGRSLWE